jgi:pimeloyl-ACP methyl ester carboxylesterase
MTADRFADIDGARIRYRVDGAGPPVLFLHGLGAFIESWNWQIAAMRDRYTTVTFDFPGFGLSEPMDAVYAPGGAAAFVVRLMDALEIRRAALVGASLGGAIATLAAGLAPGRCTALVLAAPAGFDVQVALATRLAGLPVVGECFMRLLRRAPRVGVRNAFIHRDRVPPILLESARRAFVDGAAADSCLRLVRETVDLRGVRPAVITQIRAAAAHVIAPTLIVWGNADRVIPFAHAEAAVRAIRGAGLHVISGAGHAPFIEEADAFNAVLREFLAHALRPERAGVRR